MLLTNDDNPFFFIGSEEKKKQRGLRKRAGAILHENIRSESYIKNTKSIIPDTGYPSEVSEITFYWAVGKMSIPGRKSIGKNREEICAETVRISYKKKEKRWFICKICCVILISELRICFCFIVLTNIRKTGKKGKPLHYGTFEYFKFHFIIAAQRYFYFKFFTIICLRNQTKFLTFAANKKRYNTKKSNGWKGQSFVSEKTTLE